MTDQDAIECMKLIDELRAEECSSVEIINDNADFGGPNSLIRVGGYWHTDAWPQCEETFYGDSVLDCLRKAVEAKRKAIGNVRD